MDPALCPLQLLILRYILGGPELQKHGPPVLGLSVAGTSAPCVPGERNWNRLHFCQRSPCRALCLCKGVGVWTF
ncbi:hypothetical protein CgunFtcFv8_014992 [Champsocephalus gunnari]|nr:hypothetical protein CgunFtcFv8_014992 [Champsocephalus gunnari]